VSAPVCAGSTARTGQQHAPTPMQPLFLHWRPKPQLGVETAELELGLWGHAAGADL